MEIFQWLFKLGKETGRSESSSISCTDHEPTTTLANYTDQRTRRSSTRGSKHKNSYRGIWLWCRKDVAKACFYSTLNLRRVSSFRREQLVRSMAKMKAQRGGGEEVTSTRFDPKKASKVLESEKQDETNKGKVKSEQSKGKATLLRMKELIKWAAAAKSDKAVKFFTPKIMVELRNRKKLKMMREVNNEESTKRMSSVSANISLRWESSESCTTHSSSDQISIVSSPAILVSLGPTPLYHCRSRKGNWITTDSEFVVLEL
ncbi:PREDICTED: uncharacterized protein LOC104747035 [Camelina sativa]|uniref:Uncharacterized protein LOC104747035 n=1 Tax=Camelina sativa TaxID=90675 RepID=A0ABM0W7R2_CAMSA|nr:PREDICTED: uncharacterized protein LOC104747035 [Camelina sativa]